MPELDLPKATAGDRRRPDARVARPAIWPYLAIAFLVIVVDQITKHAAVARFAFAERLAVVPGWFDLTLLYNRGAAFSFLAHHDGWQRWLFTGLAIAASAFILYLLVKHRGERAFSTALALILGGAIGNLIDRLAYGQVTDFLLFHRGDWYFPAFNLADAAITLGAATMIVDEIRRGVERRRAIPR